MPNPPLHLARVARAQHLIWTGYGHWLPNDPRGSGSTAVTSARLAELGPMHVGRKAVQPRRDELRAFYRAAEPRLLHPVVWFDDARREAIAQATVEAARAAGYTLWALAVLRNHVHAVVRVHRDRSEVVYDTIATATRSGLQRGGLVPPDHPVRAARPYAVALKTVADIRGRIRYVEQNPMKEGLPRQRWAGVAVFVG